MGDSIMSKLRISGDTSGYYDLNVPDIAGTNTIELDRVIVADASGKVGIGTSSPSANLEIKPAGADGNLKITSDANSGNNVVIAQGYNTYITASNNLYMGVGGTADNLSIVGGNVGIGTDAPSSKLSVESGTANATYSPSSYNSSSQIKINVASAQNNYAGIRFTHSGTTEGFIGLVRPSATGSVADFVIQGYSGGALAYSEKLRILDNGNVGIGTSTPFTKLHVNGNILSEQVFVGGGRSDGTSATRVIGWYQGGGDSSSNYRHIRTSLWGGGAALGNSQYIMGGFHIQSYRYVQGGGNSDAWITFHNWSGSAQNGYNYTYVGNWNADSYVYVDSTGYITLRLSNGNYHGHHVDLHQFPIYPVRDFRITGIINSSSGTL